MFFKDFTLHFNALSQGLQTTTHEPNPAREAVLSLMKKFTIFAKNLLIWRNGIL